MYSSKSSIFLDSAKGELYKSVPPLALSCLAGMDVEISLLGISVRVLQS